MPTSGFDETLYVSRLDALDASAARHFGGKASNLGELISAGQNVPGGLAVSKEALAYFLRSGGVDLKTVERIHTLGMTFLESALSAAVELQRQILVTIESSPFPDDLLNAVQKAAGPWADKPVAVRSSCVVEDSKATSFAGQYETVLNVRGLDQVLSAIRRCWASQYNGKALNYAIARRGMPVLSPGMAVVIQEMVAADFAGVCFSTGPTKSTAEMAIVEAVVGCGEKLVGGTVTPFYYEIADSGSVRKKRFPETSGNPPDEKVIQEVAAKARHLALHFGCPQDIEWAVRGDQLYLLQARPITGPAKTSVPLAVGRGLTPRTGGDHHTHPLLILRDDLHEWMLTTCEPSTYRGASYILSKQEPDGSWRVEGHPEWDEVTTAMVATLLMDGGIPASLRWPHPNLADLALGLPAAIQFIASRATIDGRWGSDLWDTCQVIRALRKCGVSPIEPVLARPVRFIQNEIGRNLEASKQQEWFGAGFLAVALRMFTELGMAPEAATCLQLLLQCQDPNGEFYGPSAAAHGTKVPSEWHTAQAISALALTGNMGPPCLRACHWLIARQQSNGSWGVSYEPYCSYNTFFTAYSLMALLDSKIETPATGRAFKWLRGMQKSSGGFGDIGSSLLAVSALQSFHGAAFTLQMPLPLFGRIQSTLGTSRIPE